VRSASPSAGTAGRAGIAEASPAGERSGRDAAPGPAQYGETSTVDQSREWPFRDTAPRQDPAESRLDPIWGADPPDAFRWHMGMTPDQEPTTPRSTTTQRKSPRDPASAERSSPSSPVDPSGMSPSEADSPHSTSPTTGTPSGADQSENEAEPAAGATSGISGSPGVEPPTNRGDAAPSNPATTIGLMARRESIGVADGQQVDQALAEQSPDRAAADRGARAVLPSEAPPDQWKAAPHPLGRPEGSGALEQHASQGEPSGEEPAPSNPPRQHTGLPATANGTTVGPASGNPAAGTSTSGVGDEVPRPGAATAAAESAAGVPRGTEPGIGWFSTGGGASQSTGALSEQLSAERPSDEPDRSSGREGPADGEASHLGTGLTSASDEHRSPELIESGMVHVDPDPEIGSPPRAAGWTELPREHVESEAAERFPATDRSRSVVQEASQVGEGTSSLDPDAAWPGGQDVAGDVDTGAVSAGSETVGDQVRGNLDAVNHGQRIASDSDPKPISTAGEAIEGTVAPAEPASGTEASAGTEAAGTAEASRATELPPRSQRPVAPGASVEGGGSTRTEGQIQTENPTASPTDASDHDRRDPASAGDAASAALPTDPFSPAAASGDELVRAGANSTDDGSSGHRSLESAPGGPAYAPGITPPAAAAGFNEAEARPGPKREQGSSNEPALSMAWSPGMKGSLDRTEGRDGFDESSPNDEVRSQRDPTWPRPFGRSSEDQDAREAGESIGSVMPLESIAESASETGPSEPLQEGSAPIQSPAAAGTAGDRPITGEATSPVEAQPSVRDELSGESHEDSFRPKDEDNSAGTSEKTEAASTGLGVVVDLTTSDLPEGSREPREALRPPEQTARPRGLDSSVAETTTLATEGTMTPASTSTATRAAEVDVRETSTTVPSVNVSRETFAGGGGAMDEEREDEAVEDEAAIAVREAVTRAAAEAGVDVSRETNQPALGALIDDLDQEPSIDTEAAARNARVTFRIHRDSLNGARRVVAVANQKGGVGKSTTAVNIGAYLALAGARVLVVDLDPQGNASTGLGLDHRDIEPSIYDVLTGEAAPTAAIRATGVANLHVLPSTIDLAGAEVELVSAMSRETRLRRALQSVDHQYDTILIDCPPSLGLLTVNALAAADELLIPIQCEYYALEGLGQLLRNVELVRANLNPELRIGGIVLTMYDGRTRLALQVVDEVRKHFTDLVYQTIVPRSVRLSEAPGYGVPIALYDPLSRGGIAYRDLTFELAERSGLLAPTGEGAS
jgi:chromosome partitioning protein